ncbi:hypothetical protein BMS3Abin05_00152 [bacterium BMS3Abin05]|nr:hypothetical protein BMS3Abin05_00152 [bacterium BMS3Abin05]GBE26443.1 hypothetical protein BMS3Bbin03_00356 [bacterium BMS3Bbin03]HDK36138.1 hypothetical protein [Bacteroidota bacterium]HDZ12727.1 hypothetical protein [Bacteroidota bacterium]
MKRWLVFAILLGWLVGSTSSVQAQGPTVEAGFYNQNIEMFFLNNLDLSNPGNSPLLFWVRIQNDSKERRVILSLRVMNRTYGVLAEGFSKPFVLKPDTLIELNNRMLAQGGSPFELENYSLNEENLRKLQDAILATGLLPSDHYSFVLQVQDVKDPAIQNEKDISLDITNPTVIELFSPGAPVGSSELPVLYTQQPQFVWNSNAKSFVIAICEKLQSNASPEEVMQNVPRYKGSVEGTSFLYPASGAYPLEEGKIYYWQITNTIETSNGPQTLESEIWGFKIAQSQSPEDQFLQNQLLVLFNSIYFEHFFRSGGPLAGFHPTGVFVLNGRIVSMEDVQMFLQKLQAGQVKIIRVEIE